MFKKMGYSGFLVVINFIVICCPFFHSDRTSAGIVGVSPAHLTGEARSNYDIGSSSTHIPEVPNQTSATKEIIVIADFFWRAK